MDVTKQNFVQSISEIEAILEQSDFIAIDCEFTGLFTTVTNDFLDTHQQYYSKCRQNISQFQIVQMGISIFKMITESKFDCHCYNFYIFPKRCSLLERQDKERYFLSQASSLSFLAENGFDFNKLIKDGISYLNMSQAEIVAEKMKDKNNTESIQINSELDKTFIEDVMEQISKFVKDKDKQELVLPQANAFRRRLIYEAVGNEAFSDQLDLSTNAADKLKITVKKCSPEEKKERERVALLEMIGFTEVIKLLVKYKKPLVGHNLYLDLLYIFNTFIAPLPENYIEFKSDFHSLFPSIFDTRYISSNNILGQLIGNNCLGKLYNAILKDPFLQTVVNLKNCDKDKERHHEAGYDSYITGCAFINLIRYLYAQDFSIKVTKSTMFSNEILDHYRNKVGIFKSYDIKYMNLEADDIAPGRKHVFHVTFPKEWKTSNLHTLFNEFGGLYSVTFIDDCSAFCVLKEQEKARQVVDKLIRKSHSPTFKLQLFDDFIKEKASDAVSTANSIRSTASSSRSSSSSSITSLDNTEKKKVKLDSSDGDEGARSSSLSPQVKKIKKDEEDDGNQPPFKEQLGAIKALKKNGNSKPKKEERQSNLFNVPEWK